mmetsp:Transcript_50193/g.54204  ORF Transcript_50193/g.54204 Transcript_50193/m.54204 type:complete len:85 (+) Transcript_50193:821-1075(+)
MALKTLAKRLIFTGVLVSKIPRKALNPTRDIIDGKKAKARISKYGFAYFMAGAVFCRTDDKAPSDIKNIAGVPTIAIKNPTNRP